MIIIYAIYEYEILDQIREYDNGQFDVIIYPLLDVMTCGNIGIIPMVNGKTGEDILLFLLINQLHLDTVTFLEIGVCHPIMRNNTYLLYELFSKIVGYKGVLVEANPFCWSLIKEYRPKDILVSGGVLMYRVKI